eukprot:CAMPEP_0202741946 /NCGR_PEP_ID=MMETSP1388-20130828/4654_1 /ASSEMBLY_ACC=CAM_ASM_000864 /TAXON_ID=37098 /ORGANISM="Isochrysis sp, Strain CCMP1244" /LENGTH=1959 /DNA_ID=CAMNT_0049408819 /DNA_START=358 /DNA_END=6236 /DNA_ORIENTATION=+
MTCGESDDWTELDPRVDALATAEAAPWRKVGALRFFKLECKFVISTGSEKNSGRTTGASSPRTATAEKAVVADNGRPFLDQESGPAGCGAREPFAWSARERKSMLGDVTFDTALAKCAFSYSSTLGRSPAKNMCGLGNARSATMDALKKAKAAACASYEEYLAAAPLIVKTRGANRLRNALMKGGKSRGGGVAKSSTVAKRVHLGWTGPMRGRAQKAEQTSSPTIQLANSSPAMDVEPTTERAPAEGEAPAPAGAADLELPVVKNVEKPGENPPPPNKPEQERPVRVLFKNLSGKTFSVSVKGGTTFRELTAETAIVCAGGSVWFDVPASRRAPFGPDDVVPKDLPVDAEVKIVGRMRGAGVISSSPCCRAAGDADNSASQALGEADGAEDQRWERLPLDVLQRMEEERLTREEGAMAACAPAVRESSMSEAFDVLTQLDDRLVATLASSAIRLVRSEWLLQQPADYRMPCRQKLEALERQGITPSPLLSAEEAVALVRRGQRAAAVLSHGWLTPGDPDPAGERFRVVISALEARPYLEAIFWDYSSLFQNPPGGRRTPEERAAFDRAIKVMGDLYASAIGTTVLQIKEIPLRPANFDGALCLYGLAEGIGEAQVRSALEPSGTLVGCELDLQPAIVRFSTHTAALGAVAAAAMRGLCAGSDLLYNERSYDGRTGDADGRADDTGRGWCSFESSISSELISRLGVVPKLRAELDCLPPKVLVLSSDALPMEQAAGGGDELGARVRQNIAAIEAACFTGSGDKPMVVELYKDYVSRIAGVLQNTLHLDLVADPARNSMPSAPTVAVPQPLPFLLADGQAVLPIINREARDRGGEGTASIAAVRSLQIKPSLGGDDCSLTFDGISQVVVPWQPAADGLATFATLTAILDALKEIIQLMEANREKLWEMLQLADNPSFSGGSSSAIVSLRELAAEHLLAMAKHSAELGNAAAVLDWLERGRGQVDASFKMEGASGVTLLMRAAKHGHEGVVDLLLRHGAGTDQQDSEGNTALMCAAINNHPTVVLRLRLAGADVNLGKEVFSYAEKKSVFKTAEELATESACFQAFKQDPRGWRPGAGGGPSAELADAELKVNLVVTKPGTSALDVTKLDVFKRLLLDVASAATLRATGAAGVRSYASGQQLTVRHAGEWRDATVDGGCVRIEGATVTLHPWNHAPLELPLAAFEVLCDWWKQTLRLQHSHLADTLTGCRLDVLQQCVAIDLHGSGSAADVNDAYSMSAWLRRLHADCCEGGATEVPSAVLLTGPPASGKTSLLSQLIVLSLGFELIPILIHAQQLQRQLLEFPDAFADAWNWVDAFLRLKYDAAVYCMLRQALTSRRALVLLDGIDEGGAVRERIERHVAEVLAPQGILLLATSRPVGLNSALFSRFHRFQLAPLSKAQQQQALEQRLGKSGAIELFEYVEMIPRDTESGLLITANPLMLSMVASVFELREGVGMPRTVAELYGVASAAMLSRSGGSTSEALHRLLQVLFFEAHVTRQRRIEDRQLDEAALSLESPSELAALRKSALATTTFEPYEGVVRLGHYVDVTGGANQGRRGVVKGFGETDTIPTRRKRTCRIKLVDGGLCDVEQQLVRSSGGDETQFLLYAMGVNSDAVREACMRLSHETRLALSEARRRVLRDELPLLSLLQTEPLQLQSSHLSFQEYFAAKHLCEEGTRLSGAPPWLWHAWWANLLSMGEQMGEPFARGLRQAAGIGGSSFGLSRQLGGDRATALRAVLLLGGVGGGKEIDVSRNALGPEEAALVSRALTLRWVGVTKLNLSNNNIGCKGCGSIANGLKVNTALTTLSLGHNDIGSDGAVAIAEALEASALIKLDLRGNSIGDTGAAAFAQALKGSAMAPSVSRIGVHIAEGAVKLASLNLSSNRIGPDGSTAIAKALQANAVLTNLNLEHNRIGDCGATAMAEAAQNKLSAEQPMACGQLYQRDKSRDFDAGAALFANGGGV